LSSADQKLLQRLRLPSLYRITPDCAPATSSIDAWRARVSAVLRADPQARMLLRVPSLDSRTRRLLLDQLCTQVIDPAQQLLVSHDVALARDCGLGVHLSAAQLRDPPHGLHQLRGWRAGSCHNAEELRHAQALGLDFVTLSPVARTASHPHAEPLGWPAFGELARGYALSVYALGGLGPNDLDTAWQHGATGVAGIRGLWAAN
jgi:8-oxo-dGTP diphosphatase